MVHVYSGFRYLDGACINWWGEVWQRPEGRYTPLPSDNYTWEAALHALFSIPTTVQEPGDVNRAKEILPSLAQASDPVEMAGIFYSQPEVVLPVLSAHHMNYELPHVILQPTPVDPNKHGNKKLLRIIYRCNRPSAWAITKGTEIIQAWYSRNPAIETRSPRTAKLFGSPSYYKECYLILDEDEIASIIAGADAVNRSYYERSLHAPIYLRERAQASTQS